MVSVSDSTLQACVDICQKCIADCKICIAYAMTEDGLSQSVTRCWSCIDACKTLIRMIEKRADSIGEFAYVCAVTCQLCAKACEGADLPHCRESAASCRACEAACLRIASAAGYSAT